MLLLHVVGWFAQVPRWSYRIPGPPSWLVAVFLLAALLLAVTARIPNFWRRAERGVAVVMELSALTIVIFPFAPRRSDGNLELTVLDVDREIRCLSSRRMEKQY
jgi:hypothetical protein